MKILNTIRCRFISAKFWRLGLVYWVIVRPLKINQILRSFQCKYIWYYRYIHHRTFLWYGRPVIDSFLKLHRMILRVWVYEAWQFGAILVARLIHFIRAERRPPSINTLNTADSMVGTPSNGRFLRNHPHKTCWIRPKESIGEIEPTLYDNVDHIRVFTS